MAVVPKQSGLEILRKLVPLNTLSDDLLSELMQTAVFEKVTKGRYLFREGDEDTDRIYLLSGALNLMQEGSEVDTVTADSNMARYPIAHSIPRKYSVKAKGKVEIVRISSEQLNAALTRGGTGIYQVQELEGGEGEEDWMGQLLQSPIFQRIPAANIQNIMMRMEEIQVSSGEMIIRQGDEGDFFYLVNQGQCAVTGESASGEIQELTRLGPGDCFGEQSLLSGNPRSSTVCMVTDGVLFRLPKKEFVEYIKLPLANSISYEEAVLKVEQGATWLDVRSPAEHERLNIPDSINVPFNALRRRTDLESDHVYVVYCQDGLISSTAVYLLMEQGLDAYVLERGLESVPQDDLDIHEAPQDSAQVINIRPEQAGQKEEAVPETSAMPDDEAGLLRERLHKTEVLAQEHLQRSRKMKLLLEKLKGRLSEAEQSAQSRQEQNQQLSNDVAVLRKELKQREDELNPLKKQQEAFTEQLKQITSERDHLQQELDNVCRQVGQLEKRLEGKEQEGSTRLQALEQERNALQDTLEEARASAQKAEQQAESLQQSLTVAESKIQSLESRVEEREGSEAQQLEAAEKQQALLNKELETLRGELEQAHGQVKRLESEYTESEQKLRREHLEQESAYKQSLEAAQAAQHQAESSLREVTTERDRLDAELSVFQDNFNQQQKRLDERDNSLQELRAELKQQAEAADNGGEVERLNKELAAAQEGERQALAAADQAAQELEELRGQTGSAGEANEQANEQIRQLEETLQNLQETIQQQKDARAVLEDKLDQAQSRIETLESQHQQQLEALQQTLQEQRAETQRLSEASAASGSSEATKALQAEVETLNEALDEADSAYEKLTSERDELKAVLDAQRQEASNETVREWEQEKEAAEAEIERLQGELNELRQLQKEFESAGGEQAAALQQELEEARKALKEQELNSSADVAEGEVLRQELEKLTKSLAERSTELEEARKESLLLEEKTEERNSEIDRLKLALEAAQLDTEEAQFKRDEAKQAREQVESALYDLQKQIESERPRDDLLAQQIVQSASDGSAATSGSGSRKSLPALLGGAVVAFALAEGLSIMGGHGELVSGLFGGADEPAVEVAGDKLETVQPSLDAGISTSPAPTSQQTQSQRDSGSDSANQASSQAESKDPEVAESEPTPQVTTEPAPRTKPEPTTLETVVSAPSTTRVVEKSTEPETGSLIQDRLSRGGRGPEMMYVRGGSFEMGSSVHILATDEQPVHKVTLPSFSIGRYEVTFRDYERFASTTGRPVPDDMGWGKGSRPVINVSWDDARAYAEWLSRQTGESYRLPTEAEWEYAAAGGTDTLYWWGFDLGRNMANCFNCGSQWDGVSSAPVGRFEANPYGLHNTAGNVMEWVSDCYHNSYRGAPVDGSSWQEAGCRERVVRGGAFNKPGDTLRLTKRNRYISDAKLFVLGFRVVREVK